ncbi:MAG TPA: protein kinase [Ktedonobacteraceae bacterium]|nr:protein kinase [Ktedonobacteraceae bacterium]
MTNLMGQQIGNYRLIQHIGKGGSADVYLGEHLYLRSHAALKLMHISLEGEAARSFLFEAQTLVRLNHRHIVRVLDFRVERGSPVLIMDYVQGNSLRQHHERGALLSLDLVVHYVKQIAEALQYAHNRQLIHRDVKPENVLLGPEQQLYLSDFGLALFAPSPTEMDTQNLVGTLPYIAPEQWHGHATFASDQYALAIMVYEWLCGKRPFGGSYFELYTQHMYDSPPPLRDLCPELPEAVEQVVLRALAKDPAQRFVSVHAFALALERASLEEVTQPLGRSTFANESVFSRAVDSEGLPVQRKLFIAAAAEDREFAERVSADLRQRGVQLAHNLFTPVKQEGVLREAIRASYLVMVVFSPHMPASPVIKEYLRIARLYRRRLVFFWASGERVAATLLALFGQTGPIDVIDGRNERYVTALDEIVDCVQEDTGLTPVAVPPLISLDDEPRNPYKGLRAFTRDDVNDFCGRDALTQRTLGMLAKMLDPRRPLKSVQRLLAIVGPSGSGKSSLLMAGVLPRLQRGALPDSEKWCYLPMFVPSQHPCDALLALLMHQFPKQNAADVRNTLAAEHGYGLYQLAAGLSTSAGGRVVLCIDQFEELFAPAVSEAECERFLKLLLNAVREPQSPLLVLLTLRADCYDRPMRYRALAHLIEANQVSVLPMDTQELRTAIEQPATQADVQLFFEGDLVDNILLELHAQNNALPLLEFTLEQLFQQRQGHWLTLEAYRELGGLRGALARHAENVYNNLSSDEHRKLAQILFLRLIDPGKSELDTTRRRAALSELLFADDAQTRLMSEVTYTFIAARLLTTSVIVDATSIEVSHEALIREWPRLATWLYEAREDILLQHAITRDAADWLKHEQASERLYRGVQLDEAYAWVGRNIANASELSFIQAALAERKRLTQEEQDRLQRELSLKRQTVRRLRGLIVAISVLLVFSIVFAFITQALNIQLNAADLQKNQLLQTSNSLLLSANANISATRGQIDTALLLANAATQRQNTFETRNTLLHTLELNPQLREMRPASQPVTVQMIALDTRYHAIIYSEGVSVFVDDTRTGKLVTVLQPGKLSRVGALVLSSDDTTLAIANNEGVWLWNVQTHVLTALKGMVNNSSLSTEKHVALSFSSDGKTLVSARCALYDFPDTPNEHCSDIEVASWNVQTTQLLAPVQHIQATIDVDTFTVSGTAHYLATSNGNSTELWSTLTGQPVAPALLATSNTSRLAFSSDGSVLAVAAENNTIQLWKSSTGQMVVWNENDGQAQDARLTGYADTITALAFSPDGRFLAASSLDRSVHLWDMQQQGLPITLNGDNQPKSALAFSQDGRMLCTSSASDSGGNMFLFWDDGIDNALSQRLPSTMLMYSPLFSPDGQRIYVGRADGTIEIRSASSSQNPLKSTLLKTDAYTGNPLSKSQSSNPLAERSLALNKDGTILAAGRTDGLITLWNVQSQSPTLLAHFLHPGLLHRVQLSDDAHVLVSSSSSGTIDVWNISNPAHPSVLMPPGQQALPASARQYVALSPDGKRLALWACVGQSCTQDQLKIWNIASRTFSPSGSQAQDSSKSGFLAFSPDNHTVASLISDLEIGFWDSACAVQSMPMLKIIHADPASAYTALHFSPDGQSIVAYTATLPDANQSFSFVVLKQGVNGFSQLSDPIQSPSSLLGDMSFRPGGTQLLSTQLIPSGNIYKGVLLSWQVSLPAWQAYSCSIAQHDLSKNDWQQYGDGDRYKSICSQFSVPSI